VSTKKSEKNAQNQCDPAIFETYTGPSSGVCRIIIYIVYNNGRFGLGIVSVRIASGFCTTPWAKRSVKQISTRRAGYLRTYSRAAVRAKDIVAQLTTVRTIHVNPSLPKEYHITTAVSLKFSACTEVGFCTRNEVKRWQTEK